MKKEETCEYEPRNYLRDIRIALGLCLLFFLRLSIPLQVTVVGFLLLVLLVLVALPVASDVRGQNYL